jgi:hypothetical protein
MKQEILEKRILQQVRGNQPIKAKKIAQILASEFDLEVVKKDVNSVLYSLKGAGLVSVDDNFEWRIEQATAQPKRNKPVPKPPTNRASSPITTRSVTGLARPPVKTPVYNPSKTKNNLTFEFTEEQQEIIDLVPSSDLLIRGQAGSGKTTVLAARAGNIVSTMAGGSILSLTYNSALCGYVKKYFANAGIGRGVDVHTFHEWAKTSADRMGYRLGGWIDEKKRKKKIEQIIANLLSNGESHRPFNLEENSEYLQWWSDEISWLFGQRVNQVSEYQNTERVGRGTSIRLSVSDRSIVWSVFEDYSQWLKDTGQEDYDNPGGLVFDLLSSDESELPENLRYDHVLIDEVQDFDRSWLLAAAKIPRVSLCLAGDIAQRIYKRNFTWKSVGIKVQGQRTRLLGSTHRATKQTMDVASC